VVYGEVAISGANSTTLNTLSSLPAVYATPLNTSTTKVGWVAGAGVEGRLGTSKWSWKVEYLHVDLGPIGARSLGALPVVDLASTRVTDEIVRLGVNYQLY
jgi:outer membrane immunogenic protein